ncbi:MAG: hypothetical protein IPJ27_12500 [Candidatus Accumulibacter sp.]|uniref:Uncharacterized protein n=1 Tax=Candidatus Accumulibacter proximus TaxID=2954385 RepID=A0A935Q026_9PROT|nr:hypothetical protein [Candidatus Accumulibacter proximus]
MPNIPPNASLSCPHAQFLHVRSSRRALVVALFPVVLAACAPDAWRPDDPFEAFLDQVQRKCGEVRIGSRSIGGDLLQNADAYFLDVTSRYYHREISGRSYAEALAGSFGTKPDSPGILCVLNLKRDKDPLPPPVLGM